MNFAGEIALRQAAEKAAVLRTQVLYASLSKVGWTDEARAAALEARRQKFKTKGDEVIAWHGTSSDKLASIRRKGIQTSFATDDPRGKVVYVTHSKAEALRHAQERLGLDEGDAKAVALELRIPKMNFHTFKLDELQEGALYSKGSISPSFINGIHIAKVGWTDEARAAALEARRNGGEAKDLTDPEQEAHLKNTLAKFDEFKQQYLNSNVNGRTAEGAVLQDGKVYPFTKASFEGDRGEQHMCFMNAGRIAMNDPSKTYVEGYISVHGVPVHHAWLVNSEGHVEDPTLRDSKGIGAYIGIPFKQDYVIKTALKTKHWGIISHTNPKFLSTKPSTYLAKFDPNQPRDKDGKWTSGGAGADSDVTAQDLLRLHATGNETIEDVEKKLTPEQIKMIQDAEEGMKGQKTTMETYKNSDGVYTDERAALHEKIVNDMFTKEKVAAATPKDGEAPTLTMTGGRPAAGKTSSLRGELKDVGDKSFYISADEIQEKLPGYTGAKAGLFNGEAQDIASQVEAVARANKLNITYDATMKTEKTALDRVAEYKADGYKVNAYFVHTAPATSAVRSVERFQRSGRYVPPHVSLNSKSNERTFDALKSHVDKWALYDNNGSSPKLIARGGK